MKKLFELQDVINMINSGDKLILAGDEELLKKLPKGNWIGGTIPYFMSENGGIHTKEMIFVDKVPHFTKNISVKFYDEKTLPYIASDEFEHGYSLLIIPAYSNSHFSFAQDSKYYTDIFLHPLVGWIAGFDLADKGKTSAKVFNGLLGEWSDSKAVVMHVELPANKIPIVDVINLFTQSDSDTITFSELGFGVSECLINGKKKIFSDYLLEKNIDTKLPLVANYLGAMINTCFSNINKEKKYVSFYAPVFPNIEYKIAAPVPDYIHSFNKMYRSLDIVPVFTCNCILNYLYSELEGKKTGNLTGPITFGEIAYQLLNQTLVYLKIISI
jgi:hypothetical protein